MWLCACQSHCPVSCFFLLTQPLWTGDVTGPSWCRWHESVLFAAQVLQPALPLHRRQEEDGKLTAHWNVNHANKLAAAVELDTCDLLTSKPGCIWLFAGFVVHITNTLISTQLQNQGANRLLRGFTSSLGVHVLLLYSTLWPNWTQGYLMLISPRPQSCVQHKRNCGGMGWLVCVIIIIYRRSS